MTARVAAEGEEPGDTLVFWVVYFNALDYPGEYVCRRSWASDGGVVFARELTARGKTLHDVREQLPIRQLGLIRMPRMLEDEAHIVETWL